MGTEIMAAQFQRLAIEKQRLAGAALRILGQAFRRYAVNAVAMRTDDVRIRHTLTLECGAQEMGVADGDFQWSNLVML